MLAAFAEATERGSVTTGREGPGPEPKILGHRWGQAAEGGVRDLFLQNEKEGEGDYGYRANQWDQRHRRGTYFFSPPHPPTHLLRPSPLTAASGGCTVYTGHISPASNPLVTCHYT